ncbi:hypothetical protein GCM10029992_36120 [Glycomyces albus]
MTTLHTITTVLRRRARAVADSGDRGSNATEYAWIAAGVSGAVATAIILTVTGVVDSLLAMLQSAIP